MKKAIPIRPIPTDAADATRWEHSALRLRMLLGVWEKDLERKLEKYLDPQRRAAWGGVDLSSNVFKSITSQLACLFDKQPTVFHPSGAAELIAPGGAIDKAGLWPMMANFQAKVLGLREYAMRVNYDPKFGLRYRPVAPCDMVAHALPENPDTPTRIEELRLREHPKTGHPMWTWDVLDVSDPKAPIYEIREAMNDGMGGDLTKLFVGRELSGDFYPYRKNDEVGTPCLPYVLFHAESTGKLFDAFSWREVVEGSLSSALLMSFFTHSARQASWPQRYAVGVRIPGAEVLDMEGQGRRARVPVDPTSLLLFEADTEGQPMVGQFQPAADIDTMLTSIIQYEHRVASWCGISSAALQREQAGTARSGYALSVTNEGKREAQRRYENQMRRGMLELISISAVMINGAEGLTLHEDGYSIRFESVPKSPDELKADREHALALIDAGLMDKIAAYQSLNPGTTRDAAIRALEEIRTVNLRFGTV